MEDISYNNETRRIHPECIKAINNIIETLNNEYKKKWGQDITFKQASYILGWKHNHKTLAEQLSELSIPIALKLVEQVKPDKGR